MEERKIVLIYWKNPRKTGIKTALAFAQQFDCELQPIGQTGEFIGATYRGAAADVLSLVIKAHSLIHDIEEVDEHGNGVNHGD